MPNLSGKNILVTGGAGFIGSHLVDRLVAQKPGRIVVVDNFFLGKPSNLTDAKKNFKNLAIYKKDADDYAFMHTAVKRHKIDIIFNLATKCLPFSFIDPEETFMVNVRIIDTLLKLLREKHYKTLVHFSSSEVYGSAQTQKIKETHPINPQTPYAAGKAAADLAAMSYIKFFGADISIIRPFNTYGPRQNEQAYAAVIPLTIKKILGGERPVIEGSGNQSRDFIFVDDVVAAAVEIYKNPATRGKAINIGTGKETKIRTVVSLAARLLDYRGAVAQKPERKGDVKRHLSDIGLAKSLIHFKPCYDFSQGLARTVNWYECSLKH